MRDARHRVIAAFAVSAALAWGYTDTTATARATTPSVAPVAPVVSVESKIVTLSSTTPITIIEAYAEMLPTGGRKIERTVTLPHRWDVDSPLVGGAARYVFTLPIVDASARQSMLFTRIGNQATIRVNDEVVATLGTLADDSEDYAKGPHVVDIPVAVLGRRQPATVEVNITTQTQRWGGLSKVDIGASESIHERFRSNYRWRQTGLFLVAVTSAFAGAIALLLALSLRHRLYAIAAAATLAGALRAIDRVWINPLLGWPWWGALVNVCYVVLATASVLFVLRALELRSALSERLCYGYALLAIPSALIAALWPLPLLWTITLAMMNVLVVVSFPLVVWTTVRRPTPERVLMCSVFAILIVVGLHDFLGVRLLGSFQLPNAGFSIAPYGFMAFSTAMMIVVVSRYVSADRAQRGASNELRRKLGEQRAELGELQQRASHQAAIAAVDQERTRILRDMHDGMGARLVSLLSMIKSQPNDALNIEREIRAALTEMKLTVDSLQPVEGDITSVLASLRYRLDPVVSASGKRLTSVIEPLPDMPWLTPASIRHVQAIVLESVTNAIHHAQGHDVSIAAHLLGDTICVEIVSNTGAALIPINWSTRGQGMTSLRRRAEELHGRLEVVPSAPEFRVSLFIPVRLPVAEAGNDVVSGG